MDVHKNTMQKFRVRYDKMITCINRQCSYRREIALQGGLVMKKSGKLKLGDNISRTL